MKRFLISALVVLMALPALAQKAVNVNNTTNRLQAANPWVTFPPTSLRLDDTDASHQLTITNGSNQAAARTLTILTTGDTTLTFPTSGTLLTSGSPGLGDVVGPASATDNAIVRFDLTTGKLIQNSAVTIADTTGAMTWAALQDASFTAGSSGASLVLVQGGNSAIFTPGGGSSAGRSITSDLGGVSVPTTEASIYISYTDTTSDAAFIDSFGTGTASGWVLRRARGTAASPTNIVDGDQIGYIDWRSYSGTKMWQQVSMAGYVDGTFTTGQAPPSRIVFSTNIANGVSTERMRLTSDGYLLLGTAAQLLSGVMFTAKHATSATDYAGLFQGGTGSGTSNGVIIRAGTTTADNGLIIRNGANTTTYMAVNGAGSMLLPTGIAASLVVGTAAQSGGNVPLISGKWSTGEFVASFENTLTAGNGLGLRIVAGTTSASLPLYIRDQSNSTTLFSVNGAGTATVGGTTASTSTTTGALTVAGGLGVAGALYSASLNLGGATVLDILTNTTTLDFGSILAAGNEDKTITVTGAAAGDTVTLGLPATVLGGAVFNGWVSAADTVTIRCNNAGSIAVDPASAVYRATVIKF